MRGAWRRMPGSGGGTCPRSRRRLGDLEKLQFTISPFFFLPPPQKYCFKKKKKPIFVVLVVSSQNPAEKSRETERGRGSWQGAASLGALVLERLPPKAVGAGGRGSGPGIAPWAHEPAAPASAHTRTCWLFPVNVPGSP